MVDRRDRKLVTRGYRCESESSDSVRGGRRPAEGEIRRLGSALRTHPPIVPHERAYSRIVVQIDTQQLPIGLSTGGGIRVAGRAGQMPR